MFFMTLKPQEDRQLGIVEDGPVLRAEEVRLQEAIAISAPLRGRGARVFGGFLTQCATILSYTSRRWRPTRLESFTGTP